LQKWFFFIETFNNNLAFTFMMLPFHINKTKNQIICQLNQEAFLWVQAFIPSMGIQFPISREPVWFRPCWLPQCRSTTQLDLKPLIR
jgi:hypothetical protein